MDYKGRSNANGPAPRTRIERHMMRASAVVLLGYGFQSDRVSQRMVQTVPTSAASCV